MVEQVRVNEEREQCLWKQREKKIKEINCCYFLLRATAAPSAAHLCRPATNCCILCKCCQRTRFILSPVCFVCVCVCGSAPPSVKQTHILRHPWHRKRNLVAMLFEKSIPHTLQTVIGWELHIHYPKADIQKYPKHTNKQSKWVISDDLKGWFFFVIFTSVFEKNPT